MLILPLIDLLIVLGTGALAVGFVLKAIAVTTIYRPALLGFAPSDFLIIAGVCWGFALVLAARTWVKVNEPRVLEMRREAIQENARERARDFEARNGSSSRPAAARERV